MYRNPRAKGRRRSQPVRATRLRGLATANNNWWIHWNERDTWPTMCRSPKCPNCRMSHER